MTQPRGDSPQRPPRSSRRSASAQRAKEEPIQLS